MNKRKAEWYIKHKLTPPKSFFDWCKSQIPSYIWSNKSKTIVSSQHKANYVERKRLTSRTNLDFFDCYKSFAIILVTRKRIEIQTYGYWSRVVNGIQSIENGLVNFEQFSNGNHVKVTEQYGQYVYGLSEQFGFMSGPYTHTKLYPNGWEERVQSVSELRYVECSKDLHFRDIHHLYKYKDEIEFLQKIGAWKLANEVMYPRYTYCYSGCRKSVDMRTINKKWLKENKAFFRNSDRDFMSYELERRIKQRDGKVVPGIEKYLDYRDIKCIPKGVGMVRFQNWVIRNEIDMSYYHDYLGLLKDLQIDPTGNENLIIPKDLSAAHDNAVQLLNQIKEEERLKELKVERERLKRRHKNLKKLEMTIGAFAFVVPTKAEDLIREGKALHHCVGGASYIEEHSQGKTTIVFVRTVDNKLTPLYTMEYKAGEIYQLRGKHNQDAPEEVYEVARKWLEIANELNKRKEQRA